MNHFERVAIFTVVENMENQLRGLKTLIAAASSASSTSQPHKTTPTLDVDSQELSDEDEDKLQEQIEKGRKLEIERMSKSAEVHFQKEWDIAAQVMSSMDG